jgi:hypothetical protein
MVLCMKTTVEIPEKILEKAKLYANKKKLTLKEVIIVGLNLLIDPSSLHNRSYTLPDCSVNGKGISPEFSGAGWAAIRDAAYGMEGK